MFAELLAPISEATGIPGLGLLLLFVVASIAGLFYTHNHPEHYEVDIAVYDSDRHHPIRFLGYTPGALQRVNLSITWRGRLQYSGKPIIVSLLRDGKILFTRQLESDGQDPSGFYLPFESEFQPGHYLARVSVDGVGTRGYDFTVGSEANRLSPSGRSGRLSVAPVSGYGLTIFVSDSFQGSSPWPPKNVIQVVPGERKWLYLAMEPNSKPPADTSVQVSVVGNTVLLTQVVLLAQPKIMTYLPWETNIEPGHYLLRVFVNFGQQWVEFPFLIEAVDRSTETASQ